VRTLADGQLDGPGVVADQVDQDVDDVLQRSQDDEVLGAGAGGTRLVAAAWGLASRSCTSRGAPARSAGAADELTGAADARAGAVLVAVGLTVDATTATFRAAEAACG